jgi:DNA invertase Pin-like site-specific DNA recombinase
VNLRVTSCQLMPLLFKRFPWEHAMRVGYARTSTSEQIAGLEAQTRDLEQAGADKLFVEQVSSVAIRPKLDAVLEFVRDGDCLIVSRLDRLARSTADLLRIIALLEAKGVGLRVLDFGGGEVDTRSPSGRLLITMFGAMAQFERELMLARQVEGIAKAKAAGKYRGRAPTAQRKRHEIMELKSQGLGAAGIARRVGVSRASVYRVLGPARD